MLRRCLYGLVCLSACAHAPAPHQPESTTTPLSPRASAVQVSEAASCQLPADERTPAERIAKHGSALDTYHREGGVWLPHAPILVNEDFDFALSMTMEGGLGAGLAAAKRKENNQKKADTLAELRLPNDVEGRIAELRCRGTHVYFLLWGGAKPALQIVVDVEEHPGKSRVVEGSASEELHTATRSLLSQVGPE